MTVLEYGTIEVTKYEMPRRVTSTQGVTPKGLASMRNYSITPRRWDQADDNYLRTHHGSQTHAEIGAALCRTVNSVRNRCYLLGIITDNSWSDGDIEMLTSWYAERDGKPLELDLLAERMVRLKSNISRKARELGLSNRKRTYVEKVNGKYPSELPMFQTAEERSAHQSRTTKEWIKQNGHPRGALGLRHTQESKDLMSRKIKAAMANKPMEEKREMGRRGAQTKIERYGTAGPANVKNPYSRARGGKREDLDNRYFRSSWEANYARYLNWLIQNGDIQGWEYEADTFVFEGYTRGAMTYRPDFKVTERDGRVIYHEVKGWMDGPSKTRLKRMAKQYPEVEIIVIGEEEYKALKKWASLIPNWEGK